MHAFGYGSAVFKQANYNVDTPDQVIDVILVVDDSTQFHSKNFKANSGHYSGWTKRLPLSITSELVQRGGSKIYFNTLIPLKTFKCSYMDSEEKGELVEQLSKDQRRFKYGVIHK